MFFTGCRQFEEGELKGWNGKFIQFGMELKNEVFVKTKRKVQSFLKNHGIVWFYFIIFN